jgi:hypothetical protein
MGTRISLRLATAMDIRGTPEAAFYRNVEQAAAHSNGIWLALERDGLGPAEQIRDAAYHVGAAISNAESSYLAAPTQEIRRRIGRGNRALYATWAHLTAPTPNVDGALRDGFRAAQTLAGLWETLTDAVIAQKSAIR